MIRSWVRAFCRKGCGYGRLVEHAVEVRMDDGSVYRFNWFTCTTCDA